MKRRVCSLALISFTFALFSVASAQETMSADKFREITASPGDNTPLNPHLLAVGPVWTNATITVDMTFARGTNFHEKIIGTLKTVKGKYVVTTVNSDFYKHPVDSITAYDEKTGLYKFWGLYGDAVTEGSMVYDLNKKTYSVYSAYRGNFLELGTGCYSDTNNWSHTIVLKDGVLFSTRDVSAVPSRPAAK